MPAGIEQPRTFHTDAGSASLELFQFTHRLSHVFFHAEDSYKVLHDLLQVAVNGVRVLAFASIKRREHVALGFGDLLIVDGSGRRFAGIRGSAKAGTSAKHQKIRKRIAAKPIAAVQSSGAFTRRKKSW